MTVPPGAATQHELNVFADDRAWPACSASGNGLTASCQAPDAAGRSGLGFEPDSVTDVTSSWWHLALATMPCRLGD